MKKNKPVDDDFGVEPEEEPRFVLFGPRTSKSLKKLYRELDDNPIFKVCNNEELLWAWYIGIPDSPINENLSDSIRWKMATARCNIQDPEKRRNYNEFVVSDNVKAAIAEFSKFSPEARMIAQNTTQEMIFNLQKLVKMNMDDFVVVKMVDDGSGSGTKTPVKEIDFGARNAYVNSCAKVAEVMPTLLKKLEEGGYGITENKKSDEKVYGRKPIDRYHDLKKS